jgi:hypothetical protein
LEGGRREGGNGGEGGRGGGEDSLKSLRIFDLCCKFSHFFVFYFMGGLRLYPLVNALISPIFGKNRRNLHNNKLSIFSNIYIYSHLI